MSRPAPPHLPAANPVDAGCLPCGWPLAHVGAGPIWCPKCEGNGHGADQSGESYEADHPPGWVTIIKRRPRSKALATRGVLGAPGLMEQCARCWSVYLGTSDGPARWWAEMTERVVMAGAATSPLGSPERALLLPSDMLPFRPRGLARIS